MWWPASRTRASRISPETSFSRVRVSETVITAMRTGMNSRGCCSGMDRPRSVRSRTRCGLAVGRPSAGRGLVEAGRRLAQAAMIHPHVGHHPLDVITRLGQWDGLDEKQRIVVVVAERLPFGEIAFARIVRGGNAEEIAVLPLQE